MPQVFNIGPYVVYFWSSEGNPLEPIHVHVAKKRPVEHASKFWITQTGKVIMANNDSQYSSKLISRLMRILEANSSIIVEKWIDYFDEIHYYC